MSAKLRGSRGTSTTGEGRGCWLTSAADGDESGADQTPLSSSQTAYPPYALSASFWNAAMVFFALLGFWRTSWSAEPQVSPSAPGIRSEPSKRKIFAAATCFASARTSAFGYEPPLTCLFGEITAPVETQIEPASG